LLKKKLTEPEFVRLLIQAESAHDWHFTLDGSRLQIRGVDQKYVFDFNQPDGTYTTRSFPLREIGSDITPFIQTDRVVVGISGPARKPIDPEYVDQQLRDIYSQYVPKETYILTGGYPGGVPLRALEIALEKGFEVVAVVPQVIFQPPFFDYLKHFKSLIKVGWDWGDETPAFAMSVDDLYVFTGGGPWTNLEYEHAMDLGKRIRMILPQRESD
jgi:hypothetical protein